MKEVEMFQWWMPPPAYKPKGKRYLSKHRMTAEEAARAGAIEPERSTVQILLLPETPEEERALRERSNTAAVQRGK